MIRFMENEMRSDSKIYSQEIKKDRVIMNIVISPPIYYISCMYL